MYKKSNRCPKKNAFTIYNILYIIKKLFSVRELKISRYFDYFMRIKSINEIFLEMSYGYLNTQI
jgi:hypothetical protein